MTDTPADIPLTLAEAAALSRTVAGVDGAWCVIESAHILADPFETNAEAWRWLDWHEGQPVSRREKVGEWFYSEQVVRRGL
jgi:hypothetical protein